MDLGLRGKTALVAGSTSGLGRATAEALAAEGARVVVLGRRAELAQEVAESLPDAVGIPADLNDPDDVEKVIDRVRESVGNPDILVLNGGGPPPSTARETSPQQAQAAVAALLLPHVRLVEAFLPGMVEAGWGRIVAIGSSGVQQPIPNLAASNLGRAALAGYLKTLAAEVAADGITVNMVLPGRIDTDRVGQLDRADAERSQQSIDDVRAAAAAAIPAGRYGRTEEFGAVVTFLASTQASYVTGEQVRCDGGMVRHH